MKNGLPIQIVSRLMRHSSVEITDKTYTHLDVNDISLVLNSAQPIVRNGLTKDQVFLAIEQAIKSTGIQNDQRFEFLIKTNKNSITATLKLK